MNVGLQTDVGNWGTTMKWYNLALFWILLQFFVLQSPNVVWAADTTEEVRLIVAAPADGETLPYPLPGDLQVELTFNQPVLLSFGSISVYDADGVLVATTSEERAEAVRDTSLTLPQGLSQGTYTVQWFVEQESGGTPYLGKYYFAVGEPSDLRNEGESLWWIHWPGLRDVAQTLSFLASLTLFGVTLFMFQHVTQERNKRWEQLKWAFFGLAFCGLAGDLWLWGRDIGSFRLVDLFSSGWGGYAALQLFFLLCGVTLRWRAWSLLGFASAIVLYAAYGHTRSSVYGGWTTIIVDGVHLLAVAAWFGGLVGLLLLAPRDGWREWLQRAGAGFSRTAFWAVLALFLSGLLLSWQMAPSWRGFVSSGWGMAVLLKAVLLLGVVGLAYWQRLALRDGVLRVLGFVRRGIVELLLGVVILAVAAVLIDLSPDATDREIQPAVQEVQGVKAVLEVTPFVIGNNRFEVRFTGESTDFQQVGLRIGIPTLMPETAWNAFSLGEGVYRVVGNQFHMGGKWLVTVVAERENGEVLEFPFEVKLGMYAYQ